MQNDIDIIYNASELSETSKISFIIGKFRFCLRHM